MHTEEPYVQPIQETNRFQMLMPCVIVSSSQVAGAGLWIQHCSGGFPPKQREQMLNKDPIHCYLRLRGSSQGDTHMLYLVIHKQCISQYILLMDRAMGTETQTPQT